MPFEGRRLRDLTEADIRDLITAGVAEHLFLEYKSELYGNNHDGHREFLLDVCMFGNAQGGLLLIGVQEQRDDLNQPTGLADPSAELGIQTPNPESLLHSYDARVVSCISERLVIESHPIPLSNGRHVLAIRVPDSRQKPHCVTLQGHTYFPSRRERQRYPMDVREIKELTMRVASQLERAQSLIRDSLRPINYDFDGPILTAVLVPMFFSDFLVDLKSEDLYQRFGQFNLSPSTNEFIAPKFTLEGLRRASPRHNVILARNGIITLSAVLWFRERTPENSRRTFEFPPTQIDDLLKRFVEQAQSIYSLGAIPSQALMAISLRSDFPMVVTDPEGFPDRTAPEGAREFPVLQIDNIREPAERLIRPLCDVVYQMFGYSGSPRFTAEGNWNGPIS